MSNQPEQKNPMDRQVGGGHYKDLAIQPAEFWIRNQLPATQGAIVKYLTRYRFAKGREDLEKAIHFIEMLMFWHFDVADRIVPLHWSESFVWDITPEEYVRKNEMREAEAAALILVCRFYCREHLELAKSFIQGVRKREYPTGGEELETILTGGDAGKPIFVEKDAVLAPPAKVFFTLPQALHVAINRLDDCMGWYRQLAREESAAPINLERHRLNKIGETISACRDALRHAEQKAGEL